MVFGIDDILIGVAVTGLATSVYGSIKAGQDKAHAAELDAALKNQQADELIQREAINEQIIKDQSERAQKQYGAAFAGTGREGGGIGGTLEIQRTTALTLANSRRDANFKAQMLRSGANIASNLASDEITASYITGAGTALTGAASLGATAYRSSAPSQNPTSLPKVNS